MKLLFKNCDIIATENGEFSVIKNGYLGIDGDTIDYVGTIIPKSCYDEEKDMAGKLLFPGLINTHTHTPMCLLRGVGSGLPLKEWLFDTVFPIEDRLTPEDIETGSALAALEMIACGTTSFTDMYMAPQVTAKIVEKSGLKANLCRPVQSFDPGENPEKNYRLIESLDFIKNYDGSADGRIKTDFCIHAEYTCTPALLTAYSRYLNDQGGNLHIHLSETHSEHEECVKKYGVTPAGWFDRAGAFDASAFAAHCVFLTDEDMELFAKKGVKVVHNPTSNMKLGSGFAPIRKMLDKGITVGLGTDGAASNNNFNMLEEMHLAAVLHNGRAQDPTNIKPSDVLKMATVNGAVIQGRYNTGEIAVGKKADLAALDLSAPHLIPNLDPIALLVYSAQASDVCMTMVNGKILYENGEFLTLDKEQVYKDVNAAMKRIYG